MVAYTTLAGDAETGDYADFRNRLLAQLEGTRTNPYLDTEDIPTIGIGLNLRVRANLDAVSDLLGYPPQVRNDLETALAANYATNADLENALLAVTQSAGQAVFEIDDAQAFDLLEDTVVDIYGISGPTHNGTIKASRMC